MNILMYILPFAPCFLRLRPGSPFKTKKIVLWERIMKWVGAASKRVSTYFIDYRSLHVHTHVYIYVPPMPPLLHGAQALITHTPLWYENLQAALAYSYAILRTIWLWLNRLYLTFPDSCARSFLAPQNNPRRYWKSAGRVRIVLYTLWNWIPRVVHSVLRYCGPSFSLLFFFFFPILSLSISSSYILSLFFSFPLSSILFPF